LYRQPPAGNNADQSVGGTNTSLTINNQKRADILVCLFPIISHSAYAKYG